MKGFVLAAVAAVSLAGCAGITDRTGLTAEQQSCVATNAIVALDNMTVDFGDLTLTQRTAFVATTAKGIATDCAIPLSPTAQALIEAAIMVAAE